MRSRKTKKHTQKARQFPSMRAAAAGMGVSLSILKEAKAMGCEGFKVRGSVDEKQVRAFIAEHHEELSKSGTNLRDQKIAEEVRKLRIKNDRDETKLIPVEDVCRVHAEMLARVDAILEQKLSNEYPSAVAGLDVAQARVYGKRLGDQVRGEFQKLADKWRQ
jgi:hypothetical protein